MSYKKTPALFCVKSNLGFLEIDVMKTIWKNKSSISVREIVKTLKRPVAYTTIMTVVGHLYEKGFVKREKRKKTFYYSPIIDENIVIGSSLSNIFIDLNKNYGKRKILYIALSNSLPRFSIEIPAYTIPAIYGVLLTALLFFFAFSIYDTIQNLSLMGTKYYLSLLTSDLSTVMSRLQLFSSALLESIPFVNLFATLISFGLILFLVRKISRLLDIKIFVFG